MPNLAHTKRRTNESRKYYGRPHAETDICTYLLTIRRVRFDGVEAEDFKLYFKLLAASGSELLVVDGSPAEIFAAYEAVWQNGCSHVPVDRQYKYLNEKVNGIHTRIAQDKHERVILADDDIRYTSADVRLMVQLLEVSEMVRPQNYFHPMPLWARTEPLSAREADQSRMD